jgi:hypothetical protein
VGGAGHAIYSKDCLPRRATWVYGKKTKTHTMKAAFNLDQVPAAAALVITGLDSDKEGVTRVEIALNGKSLYKGPNRCQKQGWTDWRLDLPAGALKAGQNTLSIRNLEDSDSTNSRWFMLSEAKLLWSQKP